MFEIDCMICEEALTEPGALLFSPPDVWSACRKLHLCNDCYENVISAIFGIKDQMFTGGVKHVSS